MVFKSRTLPRLSILTLFLLSFIFILALAFLFSNNAFAAVPTSGLVGYWNFDEGSGTTAGDSLGSGNTGTLTNNVQGLTLHS